MYGLVFLFVAVRATDVLELMQLGVHYRPVESLAAEQSGYWRQEGRHLHRRAKSLNASSAGVVEAVDEILRQQMHPGTACHAKLHRYKTMRNTLHEHVNLVYSKERALVETIHAENSILGDLHARVKKILAQAAQQHKLCARDKAEACRQRDVYGGELKELREIGKAPQQPMALFQATTRRARRGRRAQAGLGSSARATMHARRLLSSHREYKACVGEAPTRATSLLQLSQEPQDFQPTNQQVSDHQHASTVTSGEKECQRERSMLENAWREAFMSIQNLLETANSACEDDSCAAAVDAHVQTTVPALHEERATRIKAIREAQHQLVGVRIEMGPLEAMLTKVEQVTKEAEEQCGSLEKGSEYLEEVRDLIKGMKRCPGLAAASFTIPEFQRTAVTTLDILGDTVADTDAKLTAACKDAAAEHDKEATRAATQTELRGRLVDGIPEANGFDAVVYGTCPGCHGVAHHGAAHGHLRRCYRPGATVNVKGESKNCQANAGHAVCVIDRSLAERGMGNVDLTFYFGTELPDGEEGILDTGAGFKSHSGLSFGWDCNGDVTVDYSSGRRNLGRGGGLGLNHFDRDNTCKNGPEYLPVHWNVALPNGEYDVTVDFPEYYHQDCTVEGEHWCGPETNNKACVVSKKVTVTDGKFTLQGFGHDSGKCHSVAKVVIKK